VHSIGCQAASLASDYRPEDKWAVGFGTPGDEDYSTTLLAKLFPDRQAVSLASIPT
jgi:hypothetical protein